MKWLRRVLCALDGHEWRWLSYRQPSTCRTCGQCQACGDDCHKRHKGTTETSQP